MGKVAIISDSNSGIVQKEAKELGIHILPMPFFVDGETYFEDINLTQEQFYQKLKDGCDISTSMPSVGSVTELWDGLLKEYKEIVLRFPKEMAYRVYDEFDKAQVQKQANGDLIVSAKMPEDAWLTGFLLSFGTQADILSPAYLREVIAEQAK